MPRIDPGQNVVVDLLIRMTLLRGHRASGGSTYYSMDGDHLFLSRRRVEALLGAHENTCGIGRSKYNI